MVFRVPTLVGVMESVPGAVATGLTNVSNIESWDTLRPGRIHHHHAGCPRGDPGPLPVLISFTEVGTLNAVWLNRDTTE